MEGLKQLEEFLKNLLKGKHSCLTLDYNDAHAINYSTAEEFEEFFDLYGVENWVSEEEFKKGMRENSVWTLHWYPNTPVGFYRVSASSLETLIQYVESQEWK